MESPLAGQLASGSSALGLTLTKDQQALLLGYVELLLKWNRSYNLTAVREPGQIVCRHLLDSLAIARYCPGQILLDVGTGAGLPGIPLAILFPEREFHLLDSNGKKSRFLFQVKTALGLDNINIHQNRVESFETTDLYDVVLSRAFASLSDMVVSCRHLLASGGQFLAMKGSYPKQELLAVSDLCAVHSVSPIAVPGLDEQRHLVVLTLNS